MSTSRRRYQGPAYDWRDHPEGLSQRCDHCVHRARWAVARIEGDVTDPLTWITRALACGQHLHAALNELDWCLDAVLLYDLAMIPDGGC